MSIYNVHRFRDDSLQISIYNSGGTIFLYDETNMEVIKQANPSLLQGFYGIPERDIDPPLLSLGETGSLVVFELYQDDELQAEVSLGPPISVTEERGMLWSQPQKTFLSLPSGIFCIESMDSLRLGEDDPTDAGTRLTITPGNYTVSLQSLSRKYEQNPDALLPEYFISLVPIADGEQRPENNPFLAYEYF